MSMRQDLSIAGPSSSRRRTVATPSKRPKAEVPTYKGFLSCSSEPASTLDLNQRNNVLHDYLRTNSGVKSDSQSFIFESSLGSTRLPASNDHTSTGTHILPSGTSENPISIESLP